MARLFLLFLLGSFALHAQNTNNNPFKQLEEDWPTPNEYRNASGAPGHKYWKQKADYKMKITIDDTEQVLHGDETITYTNNSPDVLTYLWVQLDQNVRAQDADKHKIAPSSVRDKMDTRSMQRIEPDFDGGFKIAHVKDAKGQMMAYTINQTMMRIDLDQPLKSGGKKTFSIKWHYNINNTQEIGGRSGYEHFAEDGNNVYCIAQFFPRMCVYNDVMGWQNKQFLGRGEFTLEFGDYEVEITVPADHLVASTGLLQNEAAVLTAEQQRRLRAADNEYEQPVIIATLEEADQRMEGKSTATKTWKYKADNVRDFAFATSRRFIWDALNTKLPSGNTAMAMSMYVKEGDCLWSKYSTKAVAHSLKWYSHYTIDYPYPVAWSIDGSMGMEYPMICFNYGRCEDDSTYSERMKYGHIGVIIHEVGHNFFPMIINSDERQWTWMDEGLNTFVQYLTEVQFERDYPSRRGPAHKITSYMGGDKSRISPIMTNSESIWQFGNNAYGKPATALNILRETVMGRELFDKAFKTYCERWAFKQPYPADFFRTMEDASGVDLDWFWRGWFYTTDHVDMALSSVEHYQADPADPSQKERIAKADRDADPINISDIRNKKSIKQTYNEADPTLDDYYTSYDPLDSDAIDAADYEEKLSSMTDDEKEILNNGKHYYEVTIKRIGGLVMPVIIGLNYEDGSTETIRIPAEIWRMGQEEVSKVIPTTKPVESIVLDPFIETADVDTSNNYWPPRKQVSRFEVFKQQQRQRGGAGGENPMQRDKKAKQLEKKIKP